jgi:hypothetical protein
VLTATVFLVDITLALFFIEGFLSFLAALFKEIDGLFFFCQCSLH